MDERRTRLGDVIDDYCPRCRLIMNHGVVGMIGDDVKKVRCNTCISEHVYRQGRLPASRRRQTSKLFEEVLKGIQGPAEASKAEPPKPDPGADAEIAPTAEEQSRPESPHRRLFTIRRATTGKPADKSTDQDPKKS